MRFEDCQRFGAGGFAKPDPLPAARWAFPGTSIAGIDERIGQALIVGRSMNNADRLS